MGNAAIAIVLLGEAKEFTKIKNGGYFFIFCNWFKQDRKKA